MDIGGRVSLDPPLGGEIVNGEILHDMSYVNRLASEKEMEPDLRLYIAHSLYYEFLDPILVASSLEGLEEATKYYLSKVRRYFPLLGKRIPRDVYFTVGSHYLFHGEAVGPDGLTAYLFNFNHLRFSVWHLRNIPDLRSTVVGGNGGSALRPSVVLLEDFDSLHDFRRSMLKYALSLGDDWIFYLKEDEG